MVENQNVVDSRFFLSAIQATESTFNGCRANNAATKALFHSSPVMRVNTRKSTKSGRALTYRSMKFFSSFVILNPTLGKIMA